jgi:glycosyltransferase involved in cell wall biosynthesis
MHDLHIGADWGKNISRGFDKVICLSLFAHKRFCEYYPQVDPHKVEVIPNGIDRDLFKLGRAYKAGECFLSNDPSHLPSLELLAKHRRLEAGEEPLSVIWSSCPDRGLDRVIDLWPGIREAFPGAKLRIFGDVMGWIRRAQANGNEDGVAQVRALTGKLGRLDDEEDSLVFEGKAGQAALAAAFMKAHLWLYPTSFEETSCITAMEAQAAGCKVICTPVGALLDTAPYAEFLSPWLPTSIWRNVATQTIKVNLQVTNEATLCNARARVPTWDHVADRWAAMIERDLRKKVDP